MSYLGEAGGEPCFCARNCEVERELKIFVKPVFTENYRPS